jgi:hypothetical protein
MLSERAPCASARNSWGHQTPAVTARITSGGLCAGIPLRDLAAKNCRDAINGDARHLLAGHYFWVPPDVILVAKSARNATTSSLGRPLVGKAWTDPLCRTKPSAPSTK